jgi:excisionase family DNA binding protein
MAPRGAGNAQAEHRATKAPCTPSTHTLFCILFRSQSASKEVTLDSRQILTLDEVSSMLRVDKATVYRMARKKRIPAAKVGRQWRFDKNQLNEWLRQQY